MALETSRFDTERLHVANWRSAQQDRVERRKMIEELATVLTPNVLRYLPVPSQLSDAPQALDGWISAREGESDVLTVRARGTSTLIGLLILAPFNEPGAARVVHIGYLFAEPAWGKGYAKELLAGLVEWQSSLGGPVTLLGGVEKGNAASARVLEKAKFHLAMELSTEGTSMFRYEIPA